MCKTGIVFTTQLTNHRKAKKTNKKTAEMRFCLFWQGQLCNSRIDFMRNLLLFGKDVKAFLQIL